MKDGQRRQIPGQSGTQQRDPRIAACNAELERKATAFAFYLLLPFALALASCIGPVALHQAVLGYDKTVHRLESEMLLLNIARMHHNLPDHYTVTSSIMATFDYRTNVGFGTELPGFDTGQNKFSFNAGATAAESPTLSIVPVQGEEFTKRILAPMGEEKFGFLVFQGAPIDLVMRLIADGIEVQRRDGTFERFILNRPEAPKSIGSFASGRCISTGSTRTGSCLSGRSTSMKGCGHGWPVHRRLAISLGLSRRAIAGSRWAVTSMN